MVYGDDEEVVRETYDDITSVEREDGWLVLFRGNDAILRGQEDHVQEVEQVNSQRPGRLAQRGRTVGPCPDSGYCHDLRRQACAGNVTIRALRGTTISTTCAASSRSTAGRCRVSSVTGSTRRGPTPSGSPGKASLNSS